MNDITKEVNAESANQELQIQLNKAQKYQKAFEELEKEILFNASINKYVAWKALPYILKYIKEKYYIK